MPVLDVLLTKVEGHRSPVENDVTIVGGIKVNSHTQIDKILKEKFGTIGECLFVDFSYNVKYEPNIGGMEIAGKVIYHAKKLTQACDNKDGKIVLRPEAFAEVQNSILASSVIQALFMARDLKLPPSIQLPRVKLPAEASKEAKEKAE